MEEEISPRPTPQQMSPPQQVHLSDYLNIVKRRKWVVIVFFLLVVGLVTFVSFRATRIYKATAQITIEQQLPPLTPIADVAPIDLRKQDHYQTQYNLLQSRNLARKVTKSLELWKVFEFNKAEDPNPSISRSEWLRNVEVKWTGWTPDSTIEESGPQINPLIVNWYLSHLQTNPVRGGRLVNISFLGPSPEFISRIANAYVTAFIKVSKIKQAKKHSQQKVKNSGRFVCLDLRKQVARQIPCSGTVYYCKMSNNAFNFRHFRSL